jgi:acetyl esterase/lipase
MVIFRFSRRKPGFLTASLAAVALAAVTACGSEAASAPAEGRGTVVSATEVADLGPAEVAAVLQAAKFDPAPVRNGVTAYRVVYRTVGIGGEPTTASQLVALPKNDTSDLPVVSWLHGTTVYRGDVASVKDTSSDRAAALLFASTGKAVSAPDYLGLGEGPGAHPYGHPEATVSAPIDALRSARELAGRHGRTLDERVLISGFSQGGPATMLVGRALADGADSYFEPGALAPVGGPFNLTRFVADAADDRIANAQLYLAYLATAWDRMFGLYDVPQQAFREPYASQVDILFDGNHQPQEIVTALPKTSKELFTDDFLDSVRQPSPVWRRHLAPLDTTCDWRPEVPVHLYQAAGDRDVVFDNVRHCESQLTAKGVQPEVSDLGEMDHNTSVRRAVPLIAEEFSRMAG